MSKKSTSRQTALVTGAGKRIGARIARHLAGAGYDLVLHCRHSRREAEALAASLRKTGTAVTLLQADLADTASLKKKLKALPPVTLLVHNASTLTRDTLASMTAEGLRTQLAVHLEAPLLLSQWLLKQLPKKAEGNIILLGDGEYGWSVAPAFFSYAVSKLALESAVDLLAAACAPRIRANLLALGPTLANAHDSKTDFARLAQLAPLKRTGGVGEVLAAIDYLLQAPGVTGQVISLANGFSLRTARR